MFAITYIRYVHIQTRRYDNCCKDVFRRIDDNHDTYVPPYVSICKVVDRTLRMIVTRSLTYYVRIRNTTQDPELSQKHTHVRINFFSHLLVSTKMQVAQTRTQIRTYVFRITLMHPITKNLSLQTYSHEISSYARNCSCLNKFNIKPIFNFTVPFLSDFNSSKIRKLIESRIKFLQKVFYLNSGFS